MLGGRETRRESLKKTANVLNCSVNQSPLKGLGKCNSSPGEIRSGVSVGEKCREGKFNQYQKVLGFILNIF